MQHSLLLKNSCLVQYCPVWCASSCRSAFLFLALVVSCWLTSGSIHHRYSYDLRSQPSRFIFLDDLVHYTLGYPSSDYPSYLIIQPLRGLDIKSNIHFFFLSLLFILRHTQLDTRSTLWITGSTKCFTSTLGNCRISFHPVWFTILLPHLFNQ